MTDCCYEAAHPSPDGFLFVYHGEDCPVLAAKIRKFGLDHKDVAMTDAEDFVAAAWFLRSGSATAAMLRLCPWGLTEDELMARIDRLIRVGAEMVAPLDPEGLLRVLGGKPVDVVVDLVDLFAWVDRGRGEGGG